MAKSVLGDILGVGYVIDPRAQGSISLSSGRPVEKKDMLYVLENALSANNLVMVRNASGYRIAPANEGGVGAVDEARGSDSAEPGFGLTVIPLQYVSGTTLSKLLEGFATRPGAIRTDPSGKLLIVVGTGSERQSAVDTVRSFDVDWLRGQSVGMYPVQNSTPEPIVGELEKIMDSGDSGLGHGLVKFQPDLATELHSGRRLEARIAPRRGALDLQARRAFDVERQRQGLQSALWRRQANRPIVATDLRDERRRGLCRIAD